MDLSLTWEQQQLKDTLDRLVAGHKGDWRALWNRLAELGVVGLTLPADVDGAGGGGSEAMAAMLALGRGNAAVPYIECTVLAAGLLDAAGSPEQRKQHLPALALGKKLAIFAHVERDGLFDPAKISVRAAREGDHWVLDGHKDVAMWADAADVLIVSARTGAGAGLYLVDPKAPGVRLRGYPTVDGHRAAEIALAGAPAELLPGGSQAAIGRALDRAAAAAVADAAGAMQALHDMTLAYAKQRRQFDQTIGAFQAVQHRLVDMFIAVETARSMACLAAVAADNEDANARARDVSAAKAHIGQRGRFVAQQAVQLHGAIAMTDEYPAGRYFKRLTALELLYGDTDWHLARFAALGGDGDSQ
ncbi:MAG: acyl-CoA dehydrogenase family protein [Rhodospirillales bacterium]